MNPLLPRFIDHRIEDERKVAQAILHAGESAVQPANMGRGKRMVGHRSAEGDQMRLRGIPITTEGVGGVQPGTSPLAACIRKLDWRGRDEYGE